VRPDDAGLYTAVTAVHTSDLSVILTPSLLAMHRAGSLRWRGTKTGQHWSFHNDEADHNDHGSSLLPYHGLCY